jgi:hypothetical protein
MNTRNEQVAVACIPGLVERSASNLALSHVYMLI